MAGNKLYSDLSQALLWNTENTADETEVEEIDLDPAVQQERKY